MAATASPPSQAAPPAGVLLVEDPGAVGQR